MQQIGFFIAKRFVRSAFCSLNMFRAPLCPPSGAQDLYGCLLTVVLGALVYAENIRINLELLMMGIMVPETC